MTPQSKHTKYRQYVQ